MGIYCANALQVVHGAAKGADTIAGEIAEEMDIVVRTFPADWKKWGKAAGPIRNQEMLMEGKPDMVLAFHNNIDASKGTKHMVQIAERAGIQVLIFSAEPKTWSIVNNSLTITGPEVKMTSLGASRRWTN
jgi:hypothetical protein